jgi:hypothetical protein
LTAIGLTLVLLISAGVAFGIFTGGYMAEFVDFPIELIRQEFTVLPLLSLFLAVLIPSIFLVILGISIITKNLILNAKLGWSLFALWIISLIVGLFSIPPMIGLYSRDGVYTEAETFNVPGQTVMLDLKQVGLEDYEVTTLRLRGQEDSLFRLEKRFEAVGKSRAEAIENAKMVSYQVNVEDSVITFDSNIQFLDGARFRGQQLEMTLYIPYNRTFQMDYDMRYILRNTIYYYGYREHQIGTNTWMFTPDGLQCLTCSETNNTSENLDLDIDTDGQTITYDMTGFESIRIASVFKAEIFQGDDWEVLLRGDEEDLEDVMIKMQNDNLEVNYSRDLSGWDSGREAVYIYLRLPELESLELSGAANAIVKGFIQNLMQIDISGAASAEMDINVDDVDIDLEGMSKLRLYGTGNAMDVRITGASSLDAAEYQVNSATIDASGVSHVNVNASELLEVDASGGSEIRYSGNPVIQSERATGSKIIKE